MDNSNNENNDAGDDLIEVHSRWRLAGDVLSFQLKLALDGLRDILLSPISIVLAIAGLVTDSDRPGKYFYKLLDLGHKSDTWINLFGVYTDTGDPRNTSADKIVRHAEDLIIREYKKGGVVKDIKHRTDKLMDRMPKTNRAADLSGDKDSLD